jgi:hypothetical protein
MRLDAMVDDEVGEPCKSLFLVNGFRFQLDADVEAPLDRGDALETSSS